MEATEKTRIVSRRNLLKAGLYGSLATTIPSIVWLNGCRKKKEAIRPNILFISIDTLRADHLSCYGYPKLTSPNIDSLATHSHLFKKAYTTIPTTLPSHLAMFTSMYPTQLGVTSNGKYVGFDKVTLPEILKENGYSTAAFVNYFVLGNRYGFTQGFDTAITREGHADQPLRYALKWLREYKSEKPFFMFAHFFDPHTQYDPLPQFKKKFAVTDRKHPRGRGFIKLRSAFTPQVIKEDIDAYDAEIATADWAVGQLLEELNKLGILDSTMIVLVSDHGESMDELSQRNYFFDHGAFLYHHQLHVPFIVRLPKAAGTFPANVHQQPVSMIDIMPTILDMLEINNQGFSEGMSLLPILTGSGITRGPIFSESKRYKCVHDYSILDANWHLIKLKKGGFELYDLITDPGEKNNLFKSRSDIAKKLTPQLIKWIQQLKPRFVPTDKETNKEQLDKLRSLGYTQ